MECDESRYKREIAWRFAEHGQQKEVDYYVSIFPELNSSMANWPSKKTMREGKLKWGYSVINILHIVFLKQDDSLDVDRINNLPIDEYIEVIKNLKDNIIILIFSHKILHFPIFIRPK